MLNLHAKAILSMLIVPDDIFLSKNYLKVFRKIKSLKKIVDLILFIFENLPISTIIKLLHASLA